jgi:hypothetical protein
MEDVNTQLKYNVKLLHVKAGVHIVINVLQRVI